jgi:hypothetical protein
MIMRVYFSSLTLPKKAAKRVKDYYTVPWQKPEEQMKLSAAQDMTAFLLGYSDWNELNTVTKNGKNTPSKMDEDLSVAEFDERSRYQMERLARLSPVRSLSALRVIYNLQVSSSSGNNTTYYDYSHNRFHWFPDFNEWRLVRSKRSDEKMDDIDNINDSDLPEKVAAKHYRDILKEQPEALNAIWYLANVIADGVKTSAEEMSQLSASLRDTLPSELTGMEKGWLSWNFDENRDFLRAMLSLGYAYCSIGNHEKGFAWIWAYSHLCDSKIYDSEGWLKDMRLHSKYNLWVKKIDLSKPMVEMFAEH